MVDSPMFTILVSYRLTHGVKSRVSGRSPRAVEASVRDILLYQRHTVQ